MKKVSFVIPICNEEKSINILHKEILETIDIQDIDDYEIIYIDDGSTDNSYSEIQKLKQENVDTVKTIKLDSNEGKSKALSIGFSNAKYPYIVTIDSDLQDVPSELGKLSCAIKNNCGIVSGYKEIRRDNKIMVFLSRISNALIAKIMGREFKDLNSGFKVLDAKLAKSLKLAKGFHRYIPLMAIHMGYSYVEVPVLHRKRQFGNSKYSVLKFIPSIRDFLTILLIINKPAYIYYIYFILIITTLATTKIMKLYNTLYADITLGLMCLLLILSIISIYKKYYEYKSL